ncbi:chemotaxis protein CheC [Salibacterium qingdaonense]|uniref:Chemotaxis protein CheC n=1 Tax=Salibacterium qingdaonense TaxID=266892 RepID=A0A1I4PR25_9BACI|nr:chemotaxis protein CheC [Salibacterium qingdaonense]SFM30227.1 chemotaxis protein CheC [Salibacterium qingdaonense]
MTDINHIQPVHLDVLQEAGNIGAGNAATALSQLLNKKIDLHVPSVRMVDFQAMQAIAGGEEEVVAAAFLRITGEAPGSMFFILQKEEAEELAYTLTGKKVNIIDDSFDELAASALRELGNILAGAYLSALADFTGLSMQPSVPSLAVDMAGAVISEGLLEVSTKGDHAIVIDTEMEEAGNNNTDAVTGQFFLLPDPDAFEKIFKSLGVEWL